MLGTLKYRFRQGQKHIDRVVLYASLICSGIVLVHLGYLNEPEPDAEGRYGYRFIEHFIAWSFFTLFVVSAMRTLLSIWTARKIGLSHYSGLVMMGYLLLVGAAWLAYAVYRTPPAWLAFLHQSEWMYLGIFLITLAEISRSSLVLDKLYFNPTLLFVIAFLTLTLLGALLLMLPNSVQGHTPLNFVDALFMATSAVCITGLTVVDVAQTFSTFGQTVLLILIQLGGLGIMTFTGFFGYFFSGGFSFKNQLLFGEIIGQQKVGAVIRTLLKIILVTLGVEAIGVILLYFSVPSRNFEDLDSHLFFSLFHAVSAFCNAGFSIVENGFANPAFAYNYHMQMVLTFLFIAGGMGFTILFNGFTMLKENLQNRAHRLRTGQTTHQRPWIFSFNARLMGWSTLVLILLSTALTFAFESNQTLSTHEGFWNKAMAALFMGNSARTSGFSIVNTEQLGLPTIMVMLLFMWIGASPGSTGGGIKNTTFSIALLNVVNLARGKDQLEVFHRRVSSDSINKAFAIIILSLLVVGISMCLLAISDGHMGMRAIAVEAVSAYSTCGLSLGITPHLSDVGKMVICATMFVGRVGMLTILVAIIKDIRKKPYTYPEEKVLF